MLSSLKFRFPIYLSLVLKLFFTLIICQRYRFSSIGLNGQIEIFRPLDLGRWLCTANTHVDPRWGTKLVPPPSLGL